MTPVDAWLYQVFVCFFVFFFFFCFVFFFFCFFFFIVMRCQSEYLFLLPDISEIIMPVINNNKRYEYLHIV